MERLLLKESTTNVEKERVCKGDLVALRKFPGNFEMDKDLGFGVVLDIVNCSESRSSWREGKEFEAEGGDKFIAKIKFQKEFEIWKVEPLYLLYVKTNPDGSKGFRTVKQDFSLL